MSWIVNRTQSRWSLWQRLLASACIILLTLFAIAALIVLALIPVYLSSQSDRQIRSPTVSPLKVTYLIVNPDSRSGVNVDLSSVDRVRMARSFERALRLRIRNVLRIGGINTDFAKSKPVNSRRKRFVTCSYNGSKKDGPVLIFDFNLTYPIQRTCQTKKCIEKTFAEIYQQILAVPLISIDFNNVSKELLLCSIDILQYFDFLTTTTSSPSTSTSNTFNRTFTTTSAKVNSTIFTTSTSTINNSNVTTLTASITSTTITTSRVNESTNATITSASVTTTTTTTKNFTGTTSMISLNDTDVDLNVCLSKLPIVQETVSPYLIYHTSTLFAKDDQTLVVAGASKYESFTDIDGIKRRIIINGDMVYRNCQRTMDRSLPFICHANI